jgi:hypothetical protein
VTFVEKSALVVLLQVPDDSDAYKMFETLNDRGLRTSQADLVKNYLFGRAGDRLSEVQSHWSYMRGVLESLADDDITVNFLRHALIAQTGYLREVEVFERVQRVAKSEPAAVTLAASLEQLATAYVATFNPEHEQWNDYPDTARRAIEVFNLFNIRPLRPLLLAVAMRMDKNEANKSFRFLISLTVRLTIAGNTRSGSVEQPLANAAQDVYTQKTTTADGLKKSLLAIMAVDKEFEMAFEQARVSNPKLARYYLRSLETKALGEAEPWFVPHGDQSVINLEHVLPKKPEGNWPEFSNEEVRMNVTRLGNLVLLRASDNSNLRSGSFATKREIFKASPYSLTSQIESFDSWGPAAISKRQKDLAKLAVKTWPI